MSVLHQIIHLICYLPAFLALSMGLSLHNSIAVLQGFAGKQTAFIRTPKFALLGEKGTLQSRSYLSEKFSLTTLFEGLLAIYFLAAIVMALILGEYAFLLFHVLLMCGYGAICFYTLHDRRSLHQ
jgi:hypothetical protein